MALAAYRHVLRSTRIAFQGDTRIFTAAREQARKGFEQSRHLASGSEEAKSGIQHAEDVATILRQNVVQGEGTKEEGRFKLRIHKDTERGDNDTIATAGKGMMGGMRCGN